MRYNGEALTILLHSILSKYLCFQKQMLYNGFPTREINTETTPSEIKQNQRTFNESNILKFNITYVTS